MNACVDVILIKTNLFFRDEECSFAADLRLDAVQSLMHATWHWQEDFTMFVKLWVWRHNECMCRCYFNKNKRDFSGRGVLF